MKAKKNNNLGVITFGCLTMVSVLSGALSTVWLRQQICKTAKNIQFFEQQIDKLQRTNSYAVAEIAQLKSPESLKKRLGDKLIPPNSKQIVWVGRQHKSTGKFVAQQGRSQRLAWVK